MKITKKLLITSVFALSCASPALWADIIDFSYSFPLNGVPDEVTATGTFTTTPLSNGTWTILSVTGTRTVDGVSQDISNILAPNAFGGNDNLLYASGPALDGHGLSFVLSGGGGDNGTGNVNVYYNADTGAYTENSAQVGFGTFTITPETGPTGVPEPMPPTLAVLAGFGAVALWRKRHSA